MTPYYVQAENALEVGRRRVWTFLLRTPDSVEDGLRQLRVGQYCGEVAFSCKRDSPRQTCPQA